MSRVAKSPITIPAGVAIELSGQIVQIKGDKGTLSAVLNDRVGIEIDGQIINVKPRIEDMAGWMQAGTARAVINNMVTGVSKGFERRLLLVGVGYKAQAKGKVLNLALGYSHPIDHELPEGVTAETPTPTEIILKSANKQLLGQVAANVRGYRPPEPYKGKGVKYADETVLRKEAKKK
ncbi:MAG: 50S ribosomal protein L6 [Pseudomonadales bacterium]|nr:50S ribosomal protein L6 [Pseudomonadales bacterium]